ncbi:low affinity iron permease family protein [Prosthecobacter sp.]|uniref:low affinity iron permease family protein n=1 Tax=Prosthecobacter sp. TaxID=1965333 RepID=UPI002489F8BA|nr:low affinity iron permease family protein [Prosthecobacter sp.]MDI1315038.1 low affinity iron permease family protein [Prosthecobacter sp.]
MKPHKQTYFGIFAKFISRAAGKPAAFCLAGIIVLIWAVLGPVFNFSDTWQLVINTGTTIVTFLMVFLIQNSQNRDSEAMHVKLDELIRSVSGAQNELLDLEDMEEDDLDKVRARYGALAEKARVTLEKKKPKKAPAKKSAKKPRK